MATQVKWVMRLGALLIVVMLVIAVKTLMPTSPLWKSLLDFVGMCIALMFAGTLVIASMLVGSAPGRTKLGQKLSDKVNQQQTTARGVYDQKRAETRHRQTSGKEAAMQAKDNSGGRNT